MAITKDAVATDAPAVPQRRGLGQIIEDQLALRQLIREYLIPVETNNFWYTLGGVLAITLVLEVFTGILLTFVYTPDAGKAYDITSTLMKAPIWSVVINFHFWAAYVIFGLVMVHMVRVFVTGGYRFGKQGLWLGGVLLAGCVLVAFLTGESLHWDEVGFAVPWHISEFFQALGLAAAMNYTFAQLKDIAQASEKLGQIYAVHISVVPMIAILLVTLHYYLVKVKGISLPFWIKPSGKTVPFSSHIREWLIYGGAVVGALLLVAIFVYRDPGTAPQLLPTSPLYGSAHGPGGNGFKPTYPISWTHGMNVLFGQDLGIEPDIWGTVFGMAVMTVALVAIPFLDRGKKGLASWREALDLRTRGWAWLAMAVFWLVMVLGMVRNFIAAAD
ncbi:MAG: cytochrome b N-terminal domain-containing protein [Chloroflexota bacterium]|nr:cytochrome b N-terminal domain-containing protein [Chloroflexota bacterium]